MKAKQIQELLRTPEGELRRVLQESQKRLSTLQFDLAQGKVKDIREIKETKKTIARILTIFNKS